MSEIYLAYYTDKRHSNESKQLLYVGDDLEIMLGQILTYCDITLEGVEQLRNHMQTQGSETSYEYLIECYDLNKFTFDQ